MVWEATNLDLRLNGGIVTAAGVAVGVLVALYGVRSLTAILGTPDPPEHPKSEAMRAAALIAKAIRGPRHRMGIVEKAAGDDVDEELDQLLEAITSAPPPARARAALL
jgi:hypothetical protein